MKATEIVDKLKDVLLGAEASEETQKEELSTEAVEKAVEETPQEEVNLNEDEESTEKATEEVEEVEANKDLYVTKEEFSELKSMVEKLMIEMTAKDEKMNQDVPKEELSAVEEEVTPMVHSPEEKADKRLNLYAQGASRGTADIVFAKIANIKR